MTRTRLTERLREAGLVDTHYHVGPELLPRRYDVVSLADAARAWNATIVLKNHTYPTTPLASLARRRHGARFLGGVVLNRFVGGLNPDAITSAHSGNRTDVGAASPEPPLFVWMPTVHAAAHLRTLGHAFDPRWSGCCAGDHGHAAPPAPAPAAAPSERPVEAFDADLTPRPELIRVLETLAATSCVLATGHLSAAEVVELVPLARAIGVPAVVITHPHYPATRLADRELASLLRDSHVFVEHCFAVHTIEAVPLDDIAASLRVTGCEQAILSTDFGQVHSDPFPDGSIRFAGEIASRLAGPLGADQVVAMMTDNGRRLIELASSPQWKHASRELLPEIGAAR